MDTHLEQRLLGDFDPADREFLVGACRRCAALNHVGGEVVYVGFSLKGLALRIHLYYLDTAAGKSMTFYAHFTDCTRESKLPDKMYLNQRKLIFSLEKNQTVMFNYDTAKQLITAVIPSGSLPKIRTPEDFANAGIMEGSDREALLQLFRPAS